ncbi:MAG TPA: MFS transporter [Negativicutes bacterium]
MSKQKQGFLVKAAVLAIIVLQYTPAITTPALGAIAQAFPNVNLELVKQISALPNLLAIPLALSVGWLTRFMSKKILLNIAMVLLFIGGIVPAIFGDMNFILSMRAVFGLGFGIIFPLSVILIADLFEGKERDTLMGYQGSVGAAAGIVFQMIGGYLAGMYWRDAFLGFLITIPAILLILWKLPEPEKLPETVNSDNAAKPKLTSGAWQITIGTMIVQIFIFSFMTNMAIVMMSNNIGTPAQVGMLFTIFTIGAFVSGLIFGKILGIFKRNTIAFACGVMSVGLFMALNSDDLNLYYVIALIYGFGFGTFNPQLFLSIADSVHPSASALAISVMLAFCMFGQFLSPIALAYISNIVGLVGPKAGWMIAAPCLLAACLLLVVRNAVTKPKGLASANS